MPRRGVIYLVSGPRSYLSELSTSLASLRRHEPDLPVTVFSRYELPRRARCEHVRYDNGHHPLKQKVLVLRDTPYEQTLFLDTDTTVLGPITPVFEHLGPANFAAAHASLVDRTRQPPRLVELEDPSEFNTGVLLYDDSAATRAFLQRWQDTVMPQDPADMWAGHNCDQSYFNRLVPAGAADECGVVLGVLPNTVYNVRGIMVDEMKRRGIWKDARIFHHRTNQMKVRKALFSVTDPALLVESARKLTGKVRKRVSR
jgi:hypothetical protein